MQTDSGDLLTPNLIPLAQADKTHTIFTGIFKAARVEPSEGTQTPVVFGDGQIQTAIRVPKSLVEIAGAELEGGIFKVRFLNEFNKGRGTLVALSIEKVAKSLRPPASSRAPREPTVATRPHQSEAISSLKIGRNLGSFKGRVVEVGLSEATSKKKQDYEATIEDSTGRAVLSLQAADFERYKATIVVGRELEVANALVHKVKLESDGRVTHRIAVDKDTLVDALEDLSAPKPKRVKEDASSNPDIAFWNEVLKPKSERQVATALPDPRICEASAPATYGRVYPPSKEPEKTQAISIQPSANIPPSLLKQALQGSKPARTEPAPLPEVPPGITLHRPKAPLIPIVIQPDDSFSISSSFDGDTNGLGSNGVPNLTTLAQAEKMKDYSTVSVAVVVSKVHMPYLRPTTKGERMFQSIELEDQSGKMPIIVWGDQAKAIQWEQGKAYLFLNTKTQVYNNRKNLFYQEGSPVEAREIKPTEPYFVNLKPVIQKLSAQVCQGTWTNGDHFMYDCRRVTRLAQVRENATTIFGAATTEASRLVYKCVVQMVENRTELMPEKCPTCVDRVLDYLPKTDTFNCFGCVSSYRDIKCRKSFWVTWKDDTGELECKTESQEEFERLMSHLDDFGNQTKIRLEVAARKTANGKEVEYLFKMTE